MAVRGVLGVSACESRWTSASASTSVLSFWDAERVRLWKHCRTVVTIHMRIGMPTKAPMTHPAMMLFVLASLGSGRWVSSYEYVGVDAGTVASTYGYDGDGVQAGAVVTGVLAGSDQAGCVHAGSVHAGSVHAGAEGVHSHWRARRLASIIEASDSRPIVDVSITATFVGSEVDREERTGAAKTADTLIKAKVRKGNNIPGVDASI